MLVNAVVRAPPGKCMGIPPLTASFPRPLLDAAAKSWRTGVQRSGYWGTLHEEVSRVLWGMGVLHRNQHLLCGGMFCVDLALDGDKVRAGCSHAWPCSEEGRRLPASLQVREKKGGASALCAMLQLTHGAVLSMGCCMDMQACQSCDQVVDAP